MYKTENLDSGNPQLECPDDSVCYQCGTKLPEVIDGDNSDKQYFSFEGFCGAGCGAMSLAGIHTHVYTKEFMTRIAKSAKMGESKAYCAISTRDAMVSALEKLIAILECDDPYLSKNERKIIKKSRAAIAKATQC